MSDRQKGGGRRKPGEESLSLPLSSAAALSSTPIPQARHRSLSPTVAPAKRARMREEETPTTRKKKDVEGNIATKNLFSCDEKVDKWTEELDDEMAKVNEASREFDKEEGEPESSQSKQLPFPRDIALTPSQLRASSRGINTGDVLPNPDWSLTIMDWRPVIGSNDRQESFEQPRQAPIFDFHDETGHGRRQQEGSGDNTDTEFQVSSSPSFSFSVQLSVHRTSSDKTQSSHQRVTCRRPLLGPAPVLPRLSLEKLQNSR